MSNIGHRTKHLTCDVCERIGTVAELDTAECSRVLECVLVTSEIRDAVRGLAGAVTAAGDQAQAMTDLELGHLLLSGRWSTIEVHEAGRRLSRRPAELSGEAGP
jgi:hypothetical protein